jgi:hypothetical protein
LNRTRSALKIQRPAKVMIYLKFSKTPNRQVLHGTIGLDEAVFYW